MMPERLSVPALTVTEPEVVPTTPPSVSVPAPALVSPKVAPLTLPLRERVFAETVIVRAAPRVIAPVFWVRFAVPVNVRFAPKVMGLVMVAATEASSVPPLMVSVPAVPPLPPKAKVEEPATSVPAVRVVPPV